MLTWLGRAVVGVLLVAVACGGDSDPGGYGGEHRASFVDDCVTGTASRQTCGCFYDRLAAEVSFDRFERLDQELRRPLGDAPADLPVDVAALAAGCAGEHEDADGR